MIHTLKGVGCTACLSLGVDAWASPISLQGGMLGRYCRDYTRPPARCTAPVPLAAAAGPRRRPPRPSGPPLPACRGAGLVGASPPTEDDAPGCCRAYA